MNKLLLISFAFLSLNVIAQDEVEDIKSEQIDIVKSYKPFIQETAKINTQPQVPVIKPEKPTLDYSIPNIDLDVAFEPAKLKPLATRKAKTIEGKKGYIKAGFGNLKSPLLELGVAHTIQDKHTIGLLGNFYSANNTKKVALQKYSEYGIALFSNSTLESVNWSNQLTFDRRNTQFYGCYNDADTLNIGKEFKQHFQNIGFNTAISNATSNSAEIDYEIPVAINFYSDNLYQSELNLSINPKTSKKIKDHYVRLSSGYDYYSFKDTSKQNRGTLYVIPSFEFNKAGWQLHAGLNATLNEGKFYVFPFLSTQKSLWDNKVIFYNGWQIKMAYQSYKGLTEQNMWLQSNQTLTNARYEDRFLGVKGAINSFGYNLRFAQKLTRNQAFMVNDSTDLARFSLVYDDLTALNVFGSMWYNYKEKLELRVDLDFNSYDAETMEAAWHLSPLKTKVRLSYNFQNKIKVYTELHHRVGARYLDELQTNQKLKSKLDLNFGAEYNYKEIGGFFVELNNVTSNKNANYYKFDTFGFNAHAGVFFKF